MSNVKINNKKIIHIPEKFRFKIIFIQQGSFYFYSILFKIFMLKPIYLFLRNKKKQYWLYRGQTFLKVFIPLIFC